MQYTGKLFLKIFPAARGAYCTAMEPEYVWAKIRGQVRKTSPHSDIIDMIMHNRCQTLQFQEQLAGYLVIFDFTREGRKEFKKERITAAEKYIFSIWG
ncbi:MAG: hypothetical protein GY950_36495 [bacterium]|nr:hypothetical protein [bacterium]